MCDYLIGDLGTGELDFVFFVSWGHVFGRCHVVRDFFVTVADAAFESCDAFADFAHQAGYFATAKQDQDDDGDQQDAGDTDVIKHDVLHDADHWPRVNLLFPDR